MSNEQERKFVVRTRETSQGYVEVRLFSREGSRMSAAIEVSPLGDITFEDVPDGVATDPLLVLPWPVFQAFREAFGGGSEEPADLDVGLRATTVERLLNQERSRVDKLLAMVERLAMKAQS